MSQLASTNLLISFCNQSSSPLQSLCIFELISGNSRWIDLSPIPIEYRTAFVGVTGVCPSKDRIVIGTQGEMPVLALLDSVEAKVIAFLPLARCKDIHSLVFHSDYVYITSAGTNEVYRVPLSDQLLGAEELYWQYPGVSYDQDEIHLNGLTLYKERLIASCFGARTEKGDWGSGGRIFYLDNGSTIIEGLRQPHSPIAKEGRLVFAESKLERVYIFVENKIDTWVFKRTFELDGYARGITFSEQEILVGLSADRKVSRSKQTYLKESNQLRTSALIRINIETSIIRKVPYIKLLGREIYDVLPINPHCLLNSVEDTVSVRISSMEAIIISHRVTISELITDKRNLCNEYQIFIDNFNELKARYNELEACYNELEAHPIRAFIRRIIFKFKTKKN